MAQLISYSSKLVLQLPDIALPRLVKTYYQDMVIVYSRDEIKFMTTVE